MLLGFLMLSSAPVAQAADEPVSLTVLNTITGTDAVDEAVRKLAGDKSMAFKLIADGQARLKEKKEALTYNAALVLAQVAGEFKDLKASEAFYRICMDQAAKLQSAKKLLESYGELIDLFYNSKKYADSARICRELIELKTDDGKPRIVLIAVTTRFGETDFIEDDRFDTTQRLRSGVYRLMIQAITKQGDFDKALKLVDSLIKASDHWIERQLKGWVLREYGKYAEAAAIYEDVIERVAKDKTLSKEERESYLERYRYILSGVYVDLKQIDRATELLQALLAVKPDDPGYNNDLGYIWADHDMRLDEAEKLIRKALDIDRKRRQNNPNLAPEDNHDNGAYLDSLGWVLFKQKKLKDAKEVLLKAVEDKSSQHIEIYDHLGDVCLALGEKEAAIAAWKKGLEVVGEGRRELERKISVEKKLAKMQK